MTAHVAIVDDEARMGRILAMVLRRDGHAVTTWTDPRAFLDALDGGAPVDLLLTDLMMPGLSGVALCAAARKRVPELPVVLITAHGTVDTAVAAMKEGAFDYLRKPVDNARCRQVVARALEHTRLSRENRRLRAALAERFGLDAVVAVSPAMTCVLDLARRAAASTSTVLVTGESGTGKEVIARALHLHSPRVGGPFEAINCKAFGAGVLESELFGHEKGAYTGAARARKGVFERADGGTLFLDEIGEVDGDFQGKLLRALQEGEVLPVGADRPLRVDVRVIAATNRDLQAEVAAGRFREDLYYRLAVIPIHVPPLRERRADILPLAALFLERARRAQSRALAGWDAEVEGWLVAHDWPGNVRELENVIERGVVLARGERITLGDLVVGPPRSRAAPDETLHDTLDRVAAERIAAVLAETDGVRVEAARRLGVDRTTLFRLMRKYGLG
ncbi:MAG: sigma-54-dependent Fis family transcriptional regulator [Alphaproteobacteria bacterium]|nr:sigma-54-dependent Fis family transcriptional regulator [Alphaproteobacteria bacterium]